MTKNNATFLGLGAVFLWVSLAPLSVLVPHIQPFHMLSIAFLVSGICAYLIYIFKAKRFFPKLQKRDLFYCIVLVLAYFLYHYFYFSALKAIDPAIANLLNYLWPLLIVLFVGCVERNLKYYHILGVCLGFVGACFLILGGGVIKDHIGNPLYGILFALGAAFTWALFSSFNVKFQKTNPGVFFISFFIVSLLAWGAHTKYEMRLAIGLFDLLILVLLGLGPLGAAFYFWDIATKNGNMKLVGVFCYFIPLFSTLALIVMGISPLTWSVMIATLFIVGAALYTRYKEGQI